MPVNKPKLPTVFQVSAAKGAAAPKPTPVTQTRVPYTKLPLTSQQLMGSNGQVDADALTRVIGMVQDNVDAATATARTDPMVNKTIIQRVVLTNGKQTVIKHNLGVTPAGWFHCRAYAASAPFAAVETTNNGGYDTTQYLVLTASATGTYDLCVFGD